MFSKSTSSLASMTLRLRRVFCDNKAEELDYLQAANLYYGRVAMAVRELTTQKGSCPRQIETNK